MDTHIVYARGAYRGVWWYIWYHRIVGWYDRTSGVPKWGPK